MTIGGSSGPDRSSLLADRQKELEGWPARTRWHIEMHPLLHIDKPQLGVTIPAEDDLKLRKVVEVFGRYFKSELRFDFPPFSAKPSQLDIEQSVEGVLFNSRKLNATFPVAVGAGGMRLQGGERWLDWIWIHPFERGTGLMNQAWSDLEAIYGAEFKVAPPISPAMAGFLTHRDVARERWGTPSR
ncbi:hypothetical protein ABZ769_30480 [Streptomyces olivoreticuli]